MPHIQQHSSGGLVFVPTKEEREIRNMKAELQTQLSEVKALKDELLGIKKQLEGDTNA